MDNNQAYRRKYPVNQKGAKEEWLGIHQHQLEIHEELQTVEKEIKDLKKNTLLTNYQMNLLNKLETRQKELENKKLEGEFMLQRGQEFQDSIKQIKAEKGVFLGFMKQNYDNQLQEKNQIKKLENDEKLNYENNLIAYNQRKLESERRRRLQQKYNLKKEVEEQMQILAEKNKRMQAEQNMTKEESNELMKQRAMAEILKEESYKNFYRQWDQYDNNLRAIHENKVTNQMNAKENGLVEFVHKNIEQYNKKVMQQEYEKQLKFTNDKNNMINTIQNQLNDKELQRKEDIDRKMSNQNQRLNDLQNYQQYLQQQKIEKLERQNQYREVLDKQKELMVQNNMNAFRMGGPEKRMNFNDLQAYKEMSKVSYAKLIGYSPQIGGHSERVKPIPNIETNPNLNQTLSQLANLNLSPNVSPNIISQKNLNPTPVTPNLPYQYNNAKNYDLGEKKGSPQNQIFNNNHNPLINPLPTNIQNPYVAKEYMKAMQHNNIFSANAQRNLRRQE